MQDVFIKILRDGFPGEGPLAAWLSRITTNLCLNRLRDDRRRSELREIHAPKDEASAASADGKILVRALLREVDERTALAAVCVHVDGMTYAEAAEHLGVSKRTMANLLLRFKERADRLLADAPAVGGRR